MGFFTGRKGWAVFFLFAVLMVLHTGVPAAASDMEELIGKIKEAGGTDRLQEKYDIIASRVYRYSAEGEQETSYFYQDWERYIQDVGGTVTADKHGEVYGYNLEKKTAWRYLFVGDAYEAFSAEEEIIPLERLDGTEVAVEHGNEVLKITFQEPAMGSALMERMEDYGYEIGPEDQVRDEFEMDPETKEILRWKTSLIKEDGRKILFEEGNVLFYEEKTQPDLSMREWIFSDDCRTVELYADAGTEDEAFYTQTAGHGCGVMILCADRYANGFYKDPEYMQLYEKSPEKYTEGDMKVYIRSLSRMGRYS